MQAFVSVIITVLRYKKELKMSELLQSGFLKELGATALMFLVFYLTLQFFKTSVEALIKQQADFITKMFELYNKLLDATTFNSSILQKLDEKIKSFSPFNGERK